MKTLEELGISPTPWSVESYETTDIHYVVDFNDHEVVLPCKKRRNGKANARITAASPRMYDELWKICFGDCETINCRKCKGAELGRCSSCPLGGARAALAEAGGEVVC